MTANAAKQDEEIRHLRAELAEALNESSHPAEFWRNRCFLLEQTYEQDVKRLSKEIAEANARLVCPVCVGNPISDKPCICGGSARVDDAYSNLLQQLAEANAINKKIRVDLVGALTRETSVKLGLAEANAAKEKAEAKCAVDIHAFSIVNRQRCESPEGFNHQLASWSLSDWFLATLGELGEAANVAKKLNRYRDGIPGNKETEAELRVKLRREIGDAFVYLDLLAQACGFSALDAAIEVFNSKSEEIGCTIKIAETDNPGQALEEKDEKNS